MDCDVTMTEQWTTMWHALFYWTMNNDRDPDDFAMCKRGIILTSWFCSNEIMTWKNTYNNHISRKLISNDCYSKKISWMDVLIFIQKFFKNKLLVFAGFGESFFKKNPFFIYLECIPSMTAFIQQNNPVDLSIPELPETNTKLFTQPWRALVEKKKSWWSESCR